jgi:carboxylesterase type B
MIWASRLAHRKDFLPSTLAKHLSHTLDPVDATLATKLLLAYGLNIKSSANPRQTLQPILEFGNDLTFALPVTKFARAWTGVGSNFNESNGVSDERKAFVYHFNSPNPWDGPWSELVTHGLDLVFALGNYAEYLPAAQKECGAAMAKEIIAFVSEKDPWPAYEGKRGNDGAMVYTALPDDERDWSAYVPNEQSEEMGRRTVIQDLISDGAVLDKVMDAWLLFMKGP